MHKTILLKRLNDISSEILSIKKRLKPLPKGSLSCTISHTRNKDYYHWVICSDGNKVYLSKKEKQVAEQYALKKYLLSKLDDLEAEKKSIESYLKNHGNQFKNKTSKLFNHEEYSKLLLPYFTDQDILPETWQVNNDKKTSFHPESLSFKCFSGNRVRSKSEVLIDNALYENKIIYRYEKPLILENKTFHPDFTIFRKRDKKILYWEHFGIMDSSDYAIDTFNKLGIYNRNGILIDDSLIATFETKEHPLNLDLVYDKINFFLL